MERAPKEVTLGGSEIRGSASTSPEYAPKEVLLGDAPKEVLLGDAPKEVLLGDTLTEVTLGDAALLPLGYETEILAHSVFFLPQAGG